MESERQTTGTVLLLRPRNFGPNTQTAQSNRFQQPVAEPLDALQARAVAEFDGVVADLDRAGVRTLVFDDTATPVKPDAIFPNNWLTSHADGTVILYPLEAPARRSERRGDIIESLSADHGFYVRRILDMSHLESRGHFLEGTGSLVLDRVNRVAYSCLSSRTHPDALGEFAQLADYDIIAFEAEYAGRSIYHTNVMLSIGRQFAVICADAIVKSAQREAVLSRLEAADRRVVAITREQMAAFAGNLLELATGDDTGAIVISRSALDSLRPDQSQALSNCGRLVPVALDTIERVGGGSVRCMLAEIFLPRPTGAGRR